MADFFIAQAKEEEIPICAELIVSAHNALAATYSLPTTDSPEPAEERLRDARFAGARIYLVYERGTAVGTFVMSQLGEDRETFEIGKMSVRPFAWHRGIGNFMLEKAVELAGASGGACVVCAVLGVNEPVKLWLARHGFWTEAELAHADLPCDVCIMQRNIEPSPCGGACTC